MDPACTDQACVWNKSSKNIKPHKIKDNNIEAHFRHNPTPAFTFNSPKKQEFDHTPVTHRNVSLMVMSLRKSRIWILRHTKGTIQHPHTYCLSCENPCLEPGKFDDEHQLIWQSVWKLPCDYRNTTILSVVVIWQTFHLSSSFAPVIFLIMPKAHCSWYTMAFKIKVIVEAETVQKRKKPGDCSFWQA